MTSDIFKKVNENHQRGHQEDTHAADMCLISCANITSSQISSCGRLASRPAYGVVAREAQRLAYRADQTLWPPHAGLKRHENR
jgi:hypothetical protein